MIVALALVAVLVVGVLVGRHVRRKRKSYARGGLVDGPPFRPVELYPGDYVVPRRLASRLGVVDPGTGTAAAPTFTDRVE